MRNEYVKCCFCGEFILWKESHNPWPLYPEGSGDRCCLACNNSIVVPERIRRMREEEGR